MALLCCMDFWVTGTHYLLLKEENRVHLFWWSERFAILLLTQNQCCHLEMTFIWYLILKCYLKGRFYWLMLHSLSTRGRVATSLLAVTTSRSKQHQAVCKWVNNYISADMSLSNLNQQFWLLVLRILYRSDACRC